MQIDPAKYKKSLFFVRNSYILCIFGKSRPSCNVVANFGQLDDNLGPLRFNFGWIYVVLDLTSPILGPSWGQLVPSGGPVVHTWSYLGLSGDHVAHKLSRLGSPWGDVAWAFLLLGPMLHEHFCFLEPWCMSIYASWDHVGHFGCKLILPNTKNHCFPSEFLYSTYIWEKSAFMQCWSQLGPTWR